MSEVLVSRGAESPRGHRGLKISPTTSGEIGKGILLVLPRRPNRYKSCGACFFIFLPALALVRVPRHYRQADIKSALLRDCLSYYNGHGDAEPGSLAYYGGGRWHKYRRAAQDTLEPYRFGPAMSE